MCDAGDRILDLAHASQMLCILNAWGSIYFRIFGKPVSAIQTSVVSELRAELSWVVAVTVAFFQILAIALLNIYAST